MKEVNRIVFLLEKYLTDEQTHSENEELISLFAQYPFLREITKELNTEEGLKTALQEYDLLSSGRGDSSEERIWQAIHNEIHDTNAYKERKLFPYWKYLSAACILIVVLFAYWKLQVGESYTAEQVRELTAQLPPGTNKATLQLADGQFIELSSDHQGVVVGDNLYYDDGSLLMDGFTDQQMNLVLSTPKGGQYQIVLPDGTKVWMNASSTLIYPNIFIGETREIELEGEGYFEVAENKERPFVIKTASEKVKVLGTHFNVNAYTEESTSAVSLIEGSVEVVAPDNSGVIIKPGQQTLNQKGRLSVEDINTEEVVAWKNGDFMFNKESLESVMRKLARWYDLEIDVSPALHNISIWGSISRYDDFSKVLDIIQMTDENIRFKVEGRRVKLMK